MTGRKKALSIITVTVITAGVLFFGVHLALNYRPDSSVGFTFLAPPEGQANDYTATTLDDMDMAIKGHYGPAFNPDENIGLGFVFKNVPVIEQGLVLNATQPYLMAGYMIFIPQRKSDLFALKPGDTVDVLGIFQGPSKEWASLTEFSNCYFISSNMSPFPLPGGKSLIGAY